MKFWRKVSLQIVINESFGMGSEDWLVSHARWGEFVDDVNVDNLETNLKLLRMLQVIKVDATSQFKSSATTMDKTSPPTHKTLIIPKILPASTIHPFFLSLQSDTY
jgi:hypothetical protein